jgi:hypothetical protein
MPSYLPLPILTLALALPAQHQTEGSEDPGHLRQDITHDPPVHIGQAPSEPIVIVR